MPAILEDRVREMTESCARTGAKAAEMVRQAATAAGRATEAAEEFVPAARRAVRRSVRAYGDVREEALHEVKSHPARSVGVAFAAGLTIGWAVGTLRRVFRRTEPAPTT